MHHHIITFIQALLQLHRSVPSGKRSSSLREECVQEEEEEIRMMEEEEMRDANGGEEETGDCESIWSALRETTSSLGTKKGGGTGSTTTTTTRGEMTDESPAVVVKVEGDKVIIYLPKEEEEDTGSAQFEYFKSRIDHMTDCQPGDLAWADIPLLVMQFKDLKRDLLGSDNDNSSSNDDIDFNKLTLAEVGSY